jgi:hypothetical protein
MCGGAFYGSTYIRLVAVIASEVSKTKIINEQAQNLAPILIIDPSYVPCPRSGIGEFSSSDWGSRGFSA